MNLTERELALIMVALDNTAFTITQSIENGECDGHDELQPVEMQQLWDRVHTEYQARRSDEAELKL